MRILRVTRLKTYRIHNIQLHENIKKGENNIINIIPSGCITKGCKQQEITEMYDMFINGAHVFTDDKRCIQNNMLMNIALEYVKNFNGLIMTTCLDENLNKLGQINEGVTSTKMGLSPSPELAETLMVLRDLAILKYTDSKKVLDILTDSYRDVPIMKVEYLDESDSKKSRS